MKRSDMRPVLHGDVKEYRERHPTIRQAAYARTVASSSLRALKDCDSHPSSERRPPIELVNAVRIYTDPADPCVIVCSADPKPAAPSVYQPVLDLAVGGSCELYLDGTRLVSVQARLKALAAEAEEAIGSRPTWVAEWPCPGVFSVERLPDDYDPATRAPRDALTGRRKAEQRRELEALSDALSYYEYVEVPRALDAGTSHPPRVPRDLERLLRKHRPKELDALVARVAGMWRGPEDILAELAEEQRRFEQQQDIPHA